MKYDFTSILDRKGKDAIAIDAVGAQGTAYPAPRAGFDVIPMWIADMNFPVVPTIQQAMIRRSEHPAFGYFAPTEEYYDAIFSGKRPTTVRRVWSPITSAMKTVFWAA